MLSREGRLGGFTIRVEVVIYDSTRLIAWLHSISRKSFNFYKSRKELRIEGQVMHGESTIPLAENKQHRVISKKPY
jgi:hypothetical protein